MEFSSREQIIHNLEQSFQAYISKYGIDDIGIFEEEGQDDHYFLGYTIKKGDLVYHIHSPYRKNSNGGLTRITNEWTLETDDPEKEDVKGYHDIESVFSKL